MRRPPRCPLPYGLSGDALAVEDGFSRRGHGDLERWDPSRRPSYYDDVTNHRATGAAIRGLLPMRSTFRPGGQALLGLALALSRPGQVPERFGDCRLRSPATNVEVALQSRYVAMSDGARLAVDVHMPRDLAPGERLPTIVQ